MDKKLLKIRLRADGQWEHVYTDGSTDQQFRELDSDSLAFLYAERNRKIDEYAALVDLKDLLIEKALEHSDYEESKVVLQKFLRK